MGGIQTNTFRFGLFKIMHISIEHSYLDWDKGVYFRVLFSVLCTHITLINVVYFQGLKSTMRSTWGCFILKARPRSVSCECVDGACGARGDSTHGKGERARGGAAVSPERRRWKWAAQWAGVWCCDVCIRTSEPKHCNWSFIWILPPLEISLHSFLLYIY